MTGNLWEEPLESSFLEVSCSVSLHCTVPENNHTSSTEELEFPEGSGGSLKKSLPWGRFRYFLELDIVT